MFVFGCMKLLYLAMVSYSSRSEKPAPRRVPCLLSYLVPDAARVPASYDESRARRPENTVCPRLSCLGSPVRSVSDHADKPRRAATTTLGANGLSPRLRLPVTLRHHHAGECAGWRSPARVFSARPTHFPRPAPGTARGRTSRTNRMWPQGRAEPNPHESLRNGRCRTRTCGHLRVRQPGRFCGCDGFSANYRSEQGFLDVVRAIEQRPDARFCAHGVGYMWDGAVARFANSQRFFAPGCICVSRSWGFRGDLAC